MAIRLNTNLDPRFNLEVDRGTGSRTKSVLTIPGRDWLDRSICGLSALNKNGGSFTLQDEAVDHALAV